MQKKILKSKDISGRLGLEEKVKKGSSTSKVDLLPSSGGGILNKKVLDARSKAQEIIDASGKKAEKIRQEAEGLLSQVETEFKKARENGYQEGREEGLASVTEQLVAFESMKEEFYKDAEENIIKLVMMVVEKIIGKIVHGNSDAIKAIVSQALESALGEKILVRLSPEDHKIVKEAESEFRNAIDKTKRITFKADDTIGQGGCVVETEIGTIDARLETQLTAIRKALEL